MDKNIVLLGASLESDNRGVNALCIGALTLLKKTFKNIAVNIVALGPIEKTSLKSVWVDDEEIQVKIHYFNSKTLYLAYLMIPINQSIKKLINIIKSGDLFYDINEGDSFSDIYGLKRLLRHFADSGLVLKLNKRLTFLPQTIGPFKTPIGKLLSRKILRKLHKLYVRDNKYANELNELGVEYLINIDMAVYMDPKKLEFKVPRNTVGINVNGLMYFNSYKSMKDKYVFYRPFIEALIESFLAKKYKVLLVPHTYNHLTPNREDDLSAIKDLKKRLYETNVNVFSFVEGYDAQEIKGIISKTIFFIGSRMHSCIAALSTSVPTVGLAYSYKFEGTFKLFMCEEYVLNIINLKESEISQLIQRIHMFFEQRSTIKKSLLEANKRQLLKL